ncbi:Hpt domain-containing protein [Robertkochia aurantiaca]|uniref:Hpt domain-containing protein n=1 Tax=Robertkochia aurantiaca TaxID=2873700 RepID=UPI001CCCB2F6|nr:Hpt domain-containing protein [Robertkochia sp. 3YJGBD-33]
MYSEEKDITKVLLIESDSQEASRFADACSKANIQSIILKDSYEAVQYLKHKKEVDLIIAEKNCIPLDSSRFRSYLQNELQLQLPVVVSVTAEEIVNDTYSQDPGPLIQKPFEPGIIQYLRRLLMADKNVSDQQIYSLQYLEDISENDSSFIKESLILFLETTETCIPDLIADVTEEKFESARSIAHKIKPSFAMLMANRAVEICEQICHQASDEQLPELVRELYSLHEQIAEKIKRDHLKNKHV